MADGGIGEEDGVDGHVDGLVNGCPMITEADLPCPTEAGRTLKAWLYEQFGEKSTDQDEDLRLHNAAHVGDLESLRNLLDQDYFKQRINEKSVWCCGCLPCTPLRIAATAGHSDCVALLIDRGAALDLVDVKGQTALYMAVVNGHLDCVHVLLKAGANPNGCQHHRSFPIYQAARMGRVDIVRELIRFDADVDVEHRLGTPPCSSFLNTLVVCPLYISAAYHHLHCFRLLLQAGAQPDYNYSGLVCREALAKGLASCLLDAVMRHGCEAAFVSLLLDHGADPRLVPWEVPDADAMGRVKVDPGALLVYQEARRCPARLTHLCRIGIRRVMGKKRLQHIPLLPLPDPIRDFLLHKN